MMLSADKQELDDQDLIRYLLGTLPEQEAERLDELSIRDDAFVERLNSVENDLVDAYVKDELSAEDLAQFKKSYLCSPERLQKAEFAKALASFDSKRMPVSAQKEVPAKAPGSQPIDESLKGLSPWRWFAFPRLALQWGLAGGTLAMLLVASYLFLENARLNKQTIKVQAAQAALYQHEQELQRQVNDQHAANAEMVKELEGLRESQPNFDQLKTLSALLLPPTRGADGIPTLTVAPGTGLVVLLLSLESAELRKYRADLKDPATNKFVWRSTDLQPALGGKMNFVSISFPARLLRSQNYVVELSGIRANGAMDFMTSYTFHAAVK
jgi:hypothetical protein